MLSSSAPYHDNVVRFDIKADRFPHFHAGGRAMPARALDQGMGMAIGRRTVFRDSDQEDMGRVADRVALGNVGMTDLDEASAEYKALRNAIATGALITSGRHLQHGDSEQKNRAMELHTNCASAALSFPKFYLLLSGSGVGRSYDDDMMVVDWAQAPALRLVLSKDHKDYPATRSQLYRFAKDFQILPMQQDASGAWAYTSFQSITDEQFAAFEVFRDNVIMTEVGDDADVVFNIPDSREGWGQAAEIYESMAFEGGADEVLALVFSDIRPLGSPIRGMQGRPASGPLSLLRGFLNIERDVVMRARTEGMDLWEQAMRVDHHYSVEVQTGGARRAARMSTKSWRDPGIFAFIRIKSENGLWTSNNSVMVDKEFWRLVRAGRRHLALGGARAELPFWTAHALQVFEDLTHYGYINGEPGIINGDKLTSYKTGKAWQKPVHRDGRDFGSQRYQASWGKEALARVAECARRSKFPMVVNPCGEVELHVTGAYCVIADYAPLLSCPYDFLDRPAGFLSDAEAREWDDRIEETVRLAARFCVRVNLMDALYHREVARTNRIGVGPTGLHEWAWARFRYTWMDLVNEERSKPFWDLLARFSQAAKDEACAYSRLLGLEEPDTVTTAKPAGSTSKLYALSEGVHLPARRQFLRWVQFRGQKDENGAWHEDADKLLPIYEAKGYPVRELKKFAGMSIVGFPSVPMIVRLGLADELVIAPEATPEDQYQWLRLLEKHWLGDERSNQLSYTMKIYTDRCDLEAYRTVMLENQPTVKCCTIMPSKPDHELGYEYLPEEEVSMERFSEIVDGIQDPEFQQVIDMHALQCSSGACPI